MPIKIVAFYQTGNPLLPSLALGADGEFYEMRVEPRGDAFQVYLREIPSVAVPLSPAGPSLPELPEAIPK